MPYLTRSIAAFAVLVVVAACGGAGASPTPSASSGGGGSGIPNASPSVSAPDIGAIEHATSPTSVVLRYDQGGGFIAPSFTLSQTPIFTLYGDGTVVFRNPALEGPQPQGSITLLNPLRTAKLNEDQIQDLLAYALGEGGLGVARAQYDFGGVADASTATFTVDAGGLNKAVAVYALGMDDGANVPDQVARTAFGRLAERLSDFDHGGTIATDVFKPAAYRGILTDGTGMIVPDVAAWPWSSITPVDFTGPSDPNAFQMATRTLTPDDVAALGVKEPEGGFTGLVIHGPADGKLYLFVLRPLLPDETE